VLNAASHYLFGNTNVCLISVYWWFLCERRLRKISACYILANSLALRWLLFIS